MAQATAGIDAAQRRSAVVHDPRSLVANIPPNVLVHLAEYTAQRGIPVDAWFAGLALSRAQINDPGVQVSYRQARTVLARAIEAMHEPSLGLRVGCSETIGSFGLLGLTMMTSRTFGEAMLAGIDNHKICGSLLEVGFAPVDEQTVAVQAWPLFGERELLPFLCEELFASSLAIARELMGPQLLPRRLELSYPAPTWADAYSEVFGCEVCFGAPQNRILVDAEYLAVPLPGYNPLTSRQALALCQQQKDTRGVDGEIVGSVERLLRSRLREHPRLTEVARTLNLSERSLRRKLADSGRIFRDIHDQIRAERALELLRGDLSVAEIGSELGYSDPREFRRAFKRWTGMPPQDARRSAA